MEAGVVQFTPESAAALGVSIKTFHTNVFVESASSPDM